VVRNVRLPIGYNHVTVPATSHLAESQEIRDWINDYVPTEAPELNVTFQSSSRNISGLQMSGIASRNTG